MENEPTTPTASVHFANMDLQVQIDFLRDLIQKQDQSLKHQAKQIEELHRKNERLEKENEQLKSEVRRLKKLKNKPKLRSSKMNKGSNKNQGKSNEKNTKRAGSEKRSKRDTVDVHKIEIIKANVPPGSIFKGYQEYLVQGLEILVKNRLFKLERWQLLDGTYQVAKLPENLKGYHFSSELRAYILHQYHHQGVTQPLLLSQLRELGIDISSGQLNAILTEDKELFHVEKEAILESGLKVSSYIQVDDTGARHDGKNGYCTHIGNELFGWFESTGSKSRLNFLELLSQKRIEYIINEHALAYMKRHQLAPKYRDRLGGGQNIFATEAEFLKYLVSLEMTGKHHQRIATEGALIGALLHNGFRMDLAILSDDAGQFNIFQHALCWIHAERKINELIPNNDGQIQAITEIREAFWSLYNELKAYKLTPTLIMKQEIEKKFDELCGTKTYFELLNQVLKRMKRNKKELLLVLERPEIPLHNNLSENDIREYVKRRKISGSTRSEEGRRCRDTFASLKKTCKKLGVKFWDYLIDRLSGANNIPRLGELITQKAALVLP